MFVSGTIFKRGGPFALLEAWRAAAFLLILSDAQYDEPTGVFRRPRIAQRYLLTVEEVSDLFRRLAITSRVTAPALLPLPVRDSKDETILAAAFGVGADDLVTGDNDLLSLAGDPRLGAVRSVTVVEFLAILADAEREDGAEPPERSDGRHRPIGHDRPSASGVRTQWHGSCDFESGASPEPPGDRFEPSHGRQLHHADVHAARALRPRALRRDERRAHHP